MLHRSIRGPASEESDRSSPVAGTGAHHAVVEAEEVEPFPANLLLGATLNEDEDDRLGEHGGAWCAVWVYGVVVTMAL